MVYSTVTSVICSISGAFVGQLNEGKTYYSIIVLKIVMRYFHNILQNHFSRLHSVNK